MVRQNGKDRTRVEDGGFRANSDGFSVAPLFNETIMLYRVKDIGILNCIFTLFYHVDQQSNTTHYSFGISLSSTRFLSPPFVS